MENLSTPTRILDDHKQLISDLWLDQPNAHEEIERRRNEGTIAAEESERLHKFTKDGYLVFATQTPAADYRAFDDEIDRLWGEKPFDLAVGRGSGPLSFQDQTDDDRRLGYRLRDPHSHSRIIQDFYLHPEVFRYVELIFDQKAVAFQSLYFEFGSQQGLHRDPTLVVTKPPSHLLASWFALEDISERSGPLVYVPGSHRLPWYEFRPNDIVSNRVGVSESDKQKSKQMLDRICEERGLTAERLVVPRGHVLIWHGNLLHGGDRVMDPNSTRKSFVVHYSTYANYKLRRGTLKTKSDEGGTVQQQVLKSSTTDVIRRHGCAGFENPLYRMQY